jgi:hypothetical protein
MSVNKSKIQDEMQERGQYVTVPNELIEFNSISSYAKIIWVHIYSKMSDWKSSRNNIAKNLNMNATAVTNNCNDLVKFNMLKITSTGQSWDFEIIPPSLWNRTGAVGAPEGIPSGAVDRSVPERWTAQYRSGGPLTLKKKEEKLPSLTFSTLVASWFTDKPGILLGSKNRLGSLSSLVESCKSHGIPKDDLSATQFLRQINFPDTKDRKEWRQSVVADFNNLVERVYSPVKINSKASGLPQDEEEEDFSWEDEDDSEYINSLPSGANHE